MAKIFVNVTIEDIDRGNPNMMSSCPIALALLRRLERCDIHYVEVGTEKVNLGYTFTDVAILPERAQQFVRDYDYGREVSPIRFALDIPDGICNV